MTEIVGYQRSGKNLKSYEDFKSALRQSEGNWRSVNKFNCLGAYQFCPDTFKRISKLLYGTVLSKEKFLSSPEIQNKFIDKLIKVNLSDLKNVTSFLILLKKKIPNATVSGIVGGMHLGGVRGVQNYIINGIDRADANGTKISDYIKKFSGYEIPDQLEINTNIEKPIPVIPKENNQSEFSPVLIVGISAILLLILLK